MGWKDQLKVKAMKIALEQVFKAPQKRLPDLLALLERSQGKDFYRRLGCTRRQLESYALRLITHTDTGLLRTIADVFYYGGKKKPQGVFLDAGWTDAEIDRAIGQGGEQGFALYLVSDEERWGDGKRFASLSARYPQIFFGVFTSPSGPAPGLLATGKNVLFFFPAVHTKAMACLVREKRPFGFCRPYLAAEEERRAFLAAMEANGACCGFFLAQDGKEPPLRPPFGWESLLPVFVPQSLSLVREELRPAYWLLPNGDWRQKKRGTLPAYTGLHGAPWSF